MINFCTLFDHNYLSRGLALYQSLQEQCSDKFSLYILALDDIAYEWLVKKQYENVVVQSLSDIKAAYPVLNRLQEERTRAEFSWTLSSFSIQFFFKKYNLESVTYLDADLYFYNNPKLIYDELLPTESVLITPHNYYPKYDQTETSGRYCVQFMYFKNDEGGNKVLEWWRNACEECCCGNSKDGKFGDQKYLDDWLSRFPNIVHETKNLGIGVAPWNAFRFILIKKENNFLVQDKITKIEYPVVFYHFHGLKEFYDKSNQKWWDYNFSYEISESFRENLYKNYTNFLSQKESLCPKCDIHVLPKVQYFNIVKISIMKSIKMFIKSFLLFRTIKQEILKQDKKFVRD